MNTINLESMRKASNSDTGSFKENFLTNKTKAELHKMLRNLHVCNMEKKTKDILIKTLMRFSYTVLKLSYHA